MFRCSNNSFLYFNGLNGDFADAFAYVHSIFSFFLLVHYFNINFFAIIPKATHFLKELITFLYIVHFTFNFFEHVLLIGSWNLTSTLNGSYKVQISHSHIFINIWKKEWIEYAAFSNAPYTTLTQSAINWTNFNCC